MPVPSTFRSTLSILLLPLALGACADAEPEPEEPGEADTFTLTEEEKASFAVDPLKYPEMQDGRLDTVDMIGRSGDAAWHVQAMNYADEYIGMTYAAWYTGPDSAVRFAADGQPHLEDDLGNVYSGQVVAHNPRIEVETGTTAVGVYVFADPVAQNADSLTLHINDSTPPVIRIGPFGVDHQAQSGDLRMGARSSEGATAETSP
ncbi:MAG: hypothetical protein R3326_07310 [Gemmatimonadota bacterium]|nr:hypothetical protein [Gemmatimonadota bacterium]